MSPVPDLERCSERLRRFMRTSLCALDESALRPGVLEVEFSNLALDLFRVQFELNTAYRGFCERRDVRPGDLSDWRAIPAVPTAAFKDLELSCLPGATRTVVFHSSGTTAQRPSRHFHSPQSLALYKDSLWPWFARHLLDSTSSRIDRAYAKAGEKNRRFKLLILTPSPEQAPNSSLVHMGETIRRRYGGAGSVFLASVDEHGHWRVAAERVLHALEEALATARPVLMLGTAFLFLDLLEFLAERNMRLQLTADSRLMETGGYKGRSRQLPKAELHRGITEWLGIPESQIISEYGMSELSSQAYDRIACGSSPGTSASRRYQFPPWARVQIVSPETGLEADEGETGLIRVLDLANVYSVMAIQTEDLGVRDGHGFELIGRASQAEPRGCSLLAV